MPFFKKCMMCQKSLWKKYDTFKMKTLEGEHIVYLCKPQCWVNEWENSNDNEEEAGNGIED